MGVKALTKRNPLMVLYAGIAVVLASLMGIVSRGDYATGVVGVVIGSVLIVQFYRRQRNQPGARKGS
jgi:membrane associated rhomboid family serine protease